MSIMRMTIGQALEEIAQTYPDRDALIHMEMEVRYNYHLLWWEVERAAKGLLHLGTRRGDKVALWGPNVPEWIVSFLALGGMGAVTVPVDPDTTRDGLQFILEQSECKAIIMVKGLEGQEYMDMILHVKQSIPSLENVVLIGEESFPDTTPWAQLVGGGGEAEPKILEDSVSLMSPKDPVAIMYTSGTTGTPKGVVLDHAGMINKSMYSTERQGITHEDRLCLFFPLFHMFGNTCIALAGLLRGAALVIPSQTFDPSRVLKAIDKQRCTAFYGSPSMLIAILDHPEFQKKKWKTVSKGIIGGAPCPMELMRRVVEDVGASEITVAYGITEASSWITMTHPNDPLELRVSTIGTPLACNEVRIVDPATGDDLAPGSQGELCTRGFLMKEYHKMPGATAAAVDRDGWFHTGDLGEMDENGYVKVTGRLKDVIVREGVEIYPVELEEVLYKHHDISEVQVFGFPHPEKGQEVAVWVKVKEGSGLTPIALAAYAKDHVDTSRLPHYYKIVSDFPMTRSGKVQKFRLAALAQEEYTNG